MTSVKNGGITGDFELLFCHVISLQDQECGDLILITAKSSIYSTKPLFRTLNEAREITERWLYEYNSERPHESLNNLTPEEYRLMAESQEISKSAWN
ncbi:hypothetical protein BIY27_25985 [Gibbsiella quercinecans]|nr:hypothetical protein BIY27_25985 [Gibbsiella quercinecans]